MIFSPDSHLYGLNGKYHWTPRRAKAAWQRTWFALEEYLRWMPRPEKAVILMGAPASGKSSWLSENREKNTIYFDACFDTDWKRAKFTKRVWDRWNDLPVECVWLDTPKHVCKQRNATRPADRRVPDEAIDKMHRYITERPPNAEREGFSRLVHVTEEVRVFVAREGNTVVTEAVSVHGTTSTTRDADR